LKGTEERSHDSLADTGVDVTSVEERMRAQRLETPSWGYGDTGTRFAVFPQIGVPRDPFEKFSDAAQVHKLTGVCPSVAIHIPWDKVDDYGELKRHAESFGLRIGAVNPNLFQEPEILLEAYATDVRPLCAKVREDLGGVADPISAFEASGYGEKVAEERGEGADAGWS